MEHVIHIPMMIKEGGIDRSTLLLGLQERVRIIAHAFMSEASYISRLVEEFGVEVVPHNKLSIAAIRYHIKNFGDELYSNDINWQWDDDVQCFNDVSHKPYRRFRDPGEIIEYMDFLYKNAKEHNVIGMFGPTQTGEYWNRDNSPINRFSYRGTITSIVGFMPRSVNPYPDDPNLVCFEETIAILTYRQMVQGTDHRAALRDNAITYLSPKASPQDPNSPERRYAIELAVNMFGIKPIRWLHKSSWPLIEEVIKNAET